MTRTLGDELASLKIERRKRKGVRSYPGERGGGLMTVLACAVAIGAAGAALYFGRRYYAEGFASKMIVKVDKAARKPLSDVVASQTSEGYVRSYDQAMIGPKLIGRVESVTGVEGTKVKKGELLAVLEHSDLDAILESRQAQLERAKAELAEAKVTLREKRRRADRAADLVSRKNISVEDLDRELTERDVASTKVVALEASLKLIQAQVHEAERNLENMMIRAPFDGVILARDADVGETVTPGTAGESAKRGSLFTLADLDHLYVEADVNQKNFSAIDVGDPAIIEVDSIKNRKYHGTFTSFIRLGDRATSEIKVKVNIDDADAKLFPELKAKVTFVPKKSTEKRGGLDELLVFVPKTAVVRDGKHAFVWVVDLEKSVVGQIDVRLGDLASPDYELVERGLKGGETVVLNPPAILHEDMKVAIKTE